MFTDDLGVVGSLYQVQLNRTQGAMLAECSLHRAGSSEETFDEISPGLLTAEATETALSRTIFVQGVTATQVLHGPALRIALAVFGSIAQVSSSWGGHPPVSSPFRVGTFEMFIRNCAIGGCPQRRRAH